jgi:hypothetical protein
MNNKAPFIRVKKVPPCYRDEQEHEEEEEQATMSPYHREHEEEDHWGSKSPHRQI